MTMPFLKRGSRFGAKAALILSAFLLLGGYASFVATANPSGITGVSQTGCGGGGCHGGSASAGTKAVLSTTATQIQTGQTYVFTLTISNSSMAGGGCDISVQNGKLDTVWNDGLRKVGRELTQSFARAMSGGSVVFSFKYTAPATPGTDNIYAAANAVNGNGGTSGDQWNITSLPITVVAGAPMPSLNVATTLAFGTSPVGTPVTKTFAIGNTGTAPLTIYSYRLTGSADYSITDSTIHSVAAAGTQNITLKYTPSAAGKPTATLVISSNDQSAPTKSIALSGTGTAAAGGKFTFNAAQANFDTVATGSKKTKVLTLTNSGAAPMTINSVSLLGAGFIFSPGPVLPVTVVAGGNTTIGIACLPSSNGPLSGTLQLNVTEVAGKPHDTTIALAATAYTISAVGDRTALSIGMALSPNPAIGSTSLHLSMDHTCNALLSVTDLAGRVVLSRELGTLQPGTTTLPLELGSLPNGQYMVQCLIEGGKLLQAKLAIRR